MYDSEKRLLYIGIAGDPWKRWEQHSKDKPWWGRVQIFEIEWHGSRLEALRAETTEIRSRRPECNAHPGWAFLDLEAPRMDPGKFRKPAPKLTTEELHAALDAFMAQHPVLPPPADRTRLRECFGATQEQFGEVLGVSRLTVSMWERGKTDPKGSNRRNYVKLLQQIRQHLEQI
ncbi:helix-turn-helix domain-containing protein [Streptomyces sp. NPDC086989]|uniref:helix-turn-helix domain-containing protein n=1 Tax=Streptomyces sp. NPDC086989 TaxID=3365764 RepID=UPI0038045078